MTSKFEQGGVRVEKRLYRAPELVRYGALAELTQAGSGAVVEKNHDKVAGACADNASWKRLCPAAGSDIHIKQNIVRIGDHPLGIGLYLFDYKPDYRDQWGHGRQFGVMAQEVEAVMPEAVSMHPDGYRMVDYGMLGISRVDH